MSAPFAETLHAWLPWAVLASSFLGSAHCLGMCGPLVLAASQTRGQNLLYQLGRGIAYVALGAGAGGLTAFSLGVSGNGSWSWWANVASWLSAALLGSAFLAMGVRAWRGKSFHFPLPRFFQALLSRALRRKASGSSQATGALWMGMLTAFLPCGWLYTFVLTAAATGSALQGALILFFFWLGTLPALTFAPGMLRKLLSPIQRVAPRFSAILLISLGLLTVGMKMKTAGNPADAAAQASEEQVSCH